MKDFLITPLLLGLSEGTHCLLFCLPFMAPLMEGNKSLKNLAIVLKFVLGRLFGYLFFGLLVGYLGKINPSYNFEIIADIGLMVMALVLIYKVFRTKAQHHCPEKHGSRAPVLMGFITTFHFCPAFVMSALYVFTLQSVLFGVIYFLLFFLGTIGYILPLFLLGRLNKIKHFSTISLVASLIAGVLFFLFGLLGLLGLDIL